jgi:hypothetical protein
LSNFSAKPEYIEVSTKNRTDREYDRNSANFGDKKIEAAHE